MISAMVSSESLIFLESTAAAKESLVIESVRVAGALRRVRNFSKAVFQPFEEFIENSCRGLRPEWWLTSSKGAALMVDVE